MSENTKAKWIKERAEAVRTLRTEPAPDPALQCHRSDRSGQPCVGQGDGLQCDDCPDGDPPAPESQP